MMRYVTLAALAVAAGCGGRRNMPLDRDVAMEIRQQLEAGAKQAGGADAADAPQPTGFATLRGVFQFQGTPRPRDPLAISGDDAPYCSQGGRPLDEIMRVGPDGGLADVLFYLELPRDIDPDDPKWVHADYQAQSDATLSGGQAFDQKQCLFLTHVFAMRSSQSVQIINSDPIGHNTNIPGEGRTAVFNQIIPVGAPPIPYKPGYACSRPMAVTCNIHPWMKAYMMVLDTPCFAVSAEDGSFEIAHVPAGVELSFRAWHEAMDRQAIQAVQVDGQDENWSRGQWTVPPLADGETRELVITVKQDNLR